MNLASFHLQSPKVTAHKLVKRTNALLVDMHSKLTK